MKRISINTGTKVIHVYGHHNGSITLNIPTPGIANLTEEKIEELLQAIATMRTKPADVSPNEAGDCALHR